MDEKQIREIVREEIEKAMADREPAVEKMMQEITNRLSVQLGSAEF